MNNYFETDEISITSSIEEANKIYVKFKNEMPVCFLKDTIINSPIVNEHFIVYDEVNFLEEIETNGEVKCHCIICCNEKEEDVKYFKEYVKLEEDYCKRFKLEFHKKIGCYELEDFSEHNSLKSITLNNFVNFNHNHNDDVYKYKYFYYKKNPNKLIERQRELAHASIKLSKYDNNDCKSEITLQTDNTYNKSHLDLKSAKENIIKDENNQFTHQMQIQMDIDSFEKSPEFSKKIREILGKMELLIENIVIYKKEEVLKEKVLNEKVLNEYIKLIEELKNYRSFTNAKEKFEELFKHVNIEHFTPTYFSYIELRILHVSSINTSREEFFHNLKYLLKCFSDENIKKVNQKKTNIFFLISKNYINLKLKMKNPILKKSKCDFSKISKETLEIISKINDYKILSIRSACLSISEDEKNIDAYLLYSHTKGILDIKIPSSHRKQALNFLFKAEKIANEKESNHEYLYSIYKSIGVLFYRENNILECFKYFEKSKIFKNDKNDEKLINNIALSIIFMREYDLASKFFDFWLKKFQNSPLLWANRGFVIFDKSIKSAIEYYDTSISLDPNTSLFYNRKAFCLFLTSQYDEALKNFTVAIEKTKDVNFKAHYNLGIYYLSKKEYKNAVDYFNLFKKHEDNVKDFQVIKSLAISYIDYLKYFNVKENSDKPLEIIHNIEDKMDEEIKNLENLLMIKNNKNNEFMICYYILKLLIIRNKEDEAESWILKLNKEYNTKMKAIEILCAKIKVRDSKKNNEEFLLGNQLIEKFKGYNPIDQKYDKNYDEFIDILIKKYSKEKFEEINEKKVDKKVEEKIEKQRNKYKKFIKKLEEKNKIKYEEKHQDKLEEKFDINFFEKEDIILSQIVSFLEHVILNSPEYEFVRDFYKLLKIKSKNYRYYIDKYNTIKGDYLLIKMTNFNMKQKFNKKLSTKDIEFKTLFESIQRISLIFFHYNIFSILH